MSLKLWAVFGWLRPANSTPRPGQHRMATRRVPQSRSRTQIFPLSPSFKEMMLPSPLHRCLRDSVASK